jgi:membrane associated rhomboid family serine protease
MLAPFSSLSPVIKKLIIINGVIFLLGLISPVLNYYLISFFSLDPVILFEFSPKYLFGKPWSIFTYMFLHGSFFHLFANMFFGLWMFGEAVARQIGDREFLKLYLLAGTFAGLLSGVIFNLTGMNISVIGASGAVYAIMFIFCRYNPDAVVLFMFFIPMRVKTLFYVLIAVESFGAIKNLLPSFPSDGIAHTTHLLGFLGGFLYLKYLYKGVSWRPTAPSSPLNKSAIKEFFTKFFKSKKNTESKGVEDKDNLFSSTDSNEALDRILKKVSDYGVHSLTEKEKVFLENISEQRRRQKGNNVHRMDDYR